MYIARQPVADGIDALSQPVQRWPALVSDDVWQQVQEQIGGHARQPKQASGRFLLTGTLYCPRCRERGVDQRMSGTTYYYGDRGTRYMCSGAVQGGCSYSIVGHTLDASVLLQIGGLVEILASHDAHQRPALRRSWDQIRQPDDEGDLQRRREIRSAERRLTEGQRRLVAAGHRLTDGTLGARDYAALRDDLMATIDEAETTLVTLQAVKPAPALPPLDQVVKAAGSWSEIVTGADIQAQRLILGDLVERVFPARTAYATYKAEIVWTPLGRALRQLWEARPEDRATSVVGG